MRSAGKLEPVFIEDIGRMAEGIRRVARDGDVVLTMGAGSIGNVAAHMAAFAIGNDMAAPAIRESTS